MVRAQGFEPRGPFRVKGASSRLVARTCASNTPDGAIFQPPYPIDPHIALSDADGNLVRVQVVGTEPDGIPKELLVRDLAAVRQFVYASSGLSAFAPGLYSISIRATDSTGNVSIETRMWRVLQGATVCTCYQKFSGDELEP